MAKFVDKIKDFIAGPYDDEYEDDYDEYEEKEGKSASVKQETALTILRQDLQEEARHSPRLLILRVLRIHSR